MIRFLERKDLKQLVNQSTDFNKRRYGSVMKWSAYVILLITFALALNVNKVLYEIYSGVDMVLASDVLLTIIFMAGMAMVVIGYLLAVIYNIRNMLTAIEFQSAMFSSALRANTVFVLIASPALEIVYADRDAMAVFSEKYLNTIDEFLEHSIATKADIDKIRNVIIPNKYSEIPITCKDKNDCEIAVLLSIFPLDKPKGYFAFKASINQ